MLALATGLITVALSACRTDLEEAALPGLEKDEPSSASSKLKASDTTAPVARSDVANASGRVVEVNSATRRTIARMRPGRAAMVVDTQTVMAADVSADSTQGGNPPTEPMGATTARATEAIGSTTINLFLPETASGDNSSDGSMDDDSDDSGDDNGNDNSADDSNDSGNDNGNDNSIDDSDDSVDDSHNDNGVDDSEDSADDGSDDSGDGNGNDNSADDSDDSGHENGNDNSADDSGDSEDDNHNDNGVDDSDDSEDDSAGDGSDDSGDDSSDDSSDE